MSSVTIEDLQALDLVVGTVVAAEKIEGLRASAYRVEVDFGPEIGIRKTSSQVTDLYAADDLIGRQVVGLVNIPVKQIGRMMSEFLLTGFYRDDGAVVLAVPDKPVANGARLS